MTTKPGTIALKAVFTTLFLATLLLWGCHTPPEPVEKKPLPVQPAPEPVAELEPFTCDWPGTTWIFRDQPRGTREFPGYRGFHLGRDGRLLLINMNKATGDTWVGFDNTLSLTLSEDSGIPGLPVEGAFHTFVPESGNDKEGLRMRLVPREAPGTPGVILELVQANVDVIENHWIPRELEGGQNLMWPMNREIHLMLLPEFGGGMGILGYGGVNRFRGSIILGPEEFRTGPISMTRKIGPESNFEMTYVSRIAESNRYVQVEDDLFLYEDTRPKAAFRVRLFD